MDASERIKSLIQAWPEQAGRKPYIRLQRVASLFGKKKLQTLALGVSTEDIQDKLDIVRRWHQDYHFGTLKADKETSREQQYNQDFFMKILGYNEKPAAPFTFEPKATTEKKQLPDAVLSHTDTSAGLANIAAVVELKGASIALDRPQRREGNMSPVQQGFKYKTQYRTCPFVVVSNFYEFRLYNDNQLDFERWTLDDLVNPEDDFFAFKTWYGLLRAENFTSVRGQSKTEQLLSHVRVEQESIGKKFYVEYKDARLELLRDVYRLNPELRTQFDVAIQLGQKIVDRIVFACFAEDRGLLPEDILGTTVKMADENPYQDLWMGLQALFSAIDTGSAAIGVPVGYNGGLFAYDQRLAQLRVSDDAIRKVVTLDKYDFEEELSVNILGHIFEQSISDLEEIKRKVDEKDVLAVIDDRPSRAEPSKRKKDGVFYTPDFVVQYIVEKTLGAFLRGKEDALIELHGLSRKRNDNTYRESEVRAYKQYQNVLHNVKVLDPACGSGAFLVYALDYLLRENERVASILEEEDLFTVDYWIDSILRQNLFGVDINEESVEITKLSLWLKTARAGKKLTSLDDSIKCGNSLISDHQIDPKTSFDWEAAFPEVTEKGGFDVVVGNPPYVRVQNLDNRAVDYFFNTYKSPTGKIDISILFFERALSLLHPDGKMAFVSSSQWLQTDYGRNLRRELSKGHISEIVDFGSLPVFEDASTYPAIFTLTRQAGDTVLYSRIGTKDQLNRSSVLAAPRKRVDYGQLDDKAWQFGEFDLVGHLKARSISYSPLSEVAKAYYGDVTGRDEAFVLPWDKADELQLEDALLYPYAYRQAEIQAFSPMKPDAAVIYPYTAGDDGEPVLIPAERLMARYPNIYAYLSADKENLVTRKDSRKLYAAGADWYKHVRPGSLNYITPKKLIFKGIEKRLVVGTLDVNTSFNGANCPAVMANDASVSLDFMLGLLNSKVVSFYLNEVCPKKLNSTYRYNVSNVNQIPMVATGDEKIEELTRNLIDLTAQLDTKNERFKRLVVTEFTMPAWPAKLTSWWDLDFPSFIAKTKIKASISRKEELLEFWEKYREECQVLEAQIKGLRDSVDEAVYRMYDLDDDHIAIIEGTFEA